MRKGRLFIVIVCCILAFFVSCTKENTTEPDSKNTVATPVISPSSGTYPEPIQATITCSTPDAIIRYTLDGEAPTKESARYQTEIEIDCSKTIKAFAYKDGWHDSQIVTAEYGITGKVATPEIAPSGGKFTEAQYVTITCSTDGAEIRYAFGEYNPTSDSPLYESSLLVEKTAQLNVIAYKECWARSDVATALFTIYTANPPLMQYIGKGSFAMGNTHGMNKPAELPIHKVTLSEYHIGKYPITQREWLSVMGEWEFGFPDNLDNPAENLSWYAALVFCNRLSMKEELPPVYSINGLTDPDTWGEIPTTSNSAWDAVSCDWQAEGYRLPTEAEWEFATRSRGNDTDFLYSGSNNIDLVGWHNGITPLTTRPVGLKRPNILEIYDLSGNVQEWCWDRYGGYSTNDKNNPRGPSKGDYNILRGGSFNDSADSCRISARNFESRYKATNNIGLRVVK